MKLQGVNMTKPEDKNIWTAIKGEVAVCTTTSSTSPRTSGAEAATAALATAASSEAGARPRPGTSATGETLGPPPVGSVVGIVGRSKRRDRTRRRQFGPSCSGPCCGRGTKVDVRVADSFLGKFSSTGAEPVSPLSKGCGKFLAAQGHTMARPTRRDLGGNGFGPCPGVLSGPDPSDIGSGDPSAVPADAYPIHGDPPHVETARGASAPFLPGHGTGDGAEQAKDINTRMPEATRTRCVETGGHRCAEAPDLDPERALVQDPQLKGVVVENPQLKGAVSCKQAVVEEKTSAELQSHSVAGTAELQSHSVAGTTLSCAGPAGPTRT